ncbi:hypothetical protein JRQ81_013778 [Phrynocephalus forsythii]|uniref:Zinc finger protein 710 n=1 Tax=Phrynocephalus forsythii TaxID=171643 RepID=A0A9Q1B4N0_9SAUR|nr:hypothetical protein JRQ81_013778 [Phrynocephalus forsythii]
MPDCEYPSALQNSHTPISRKKDFGIGTFVLIIGQREDAATIFAKTAVAAAAETWAPAAEALTAVAAKGGKRQNLKKKHHPVKKLVLVVVFQHPIPRLTGQGRQQKRKEATGSILFLKTDRIQISATPGTGTEPSSLEGKRVHFRVWAHLCVFLAYPWFPVTVLQLCTDEHFTSFKAQCVRYEVEKAMRTMDTSTNVATTVAAGRHFTTYRTTLKASCCWGGGGCGLLPVIWNTVPPRFLNSPRLIHKRNERSGQLRSRYRPGFPVTALSATGSQMLREELNEVKKEDPHCNMDDTPNHHFPHGLDSQVKPDVLPPLSEEFRTQLVQFGYDPPPDLQNFQGALEGDLHHHTPPQYNAHMIDLCNVGFPFYRTVEHFGAQPIKEEPVMPNMLWPGPPTFLQTPYPYYPKVHPTLMFPFIMTPNFHFRSSYPLKRPPEPPFQRRRVDEQDENKQKVDRVDVNIQIDDSYYVDVGGEQKRWQCPMCDKSYTSKYNLVTHILGHSGIKPHACSRCGKLFKQLSHLHTHMLTHQGTRPHKCQVCHKAFTQTSHLKRHMMQHSDIKPYSCRICGRGFAYPSELKVHEAKHENGRENICIECGLDFPTLAQLKRHLTTHRGPIQYNCTECDKTFQYPSQLQNHMMKHKDIRPYICTECGMEFVQPHHLKQHSLTHKGVKEHKCGICGREFTLLANMKRHVLIHTNIRAYQCHLCFKSFVQKQTLKAHMIVHSDVKPFKCKLCGKEFNRMHNLMGHMHLHSDSKPFKCLYCPSKFTLKGNLTRHMKVKHGVMERGFHSQGLGRERTRASPMNVPRELEQEEPFDLSRKGHGKEFSFHSDGESAKGSSCHEEEEDNCYERYSPDVFHSDEQYSKQALPSLAYHKMKESCGDGKRKMLHEKPREMKESQRKGNQGERDFVGNSEEQVSLSHFENNRLPQPFSDYLYFRHRNKSLKELLERKMDNQAVLLGI